jgi:hypothetical protein
VITSTDRLAKMLERARNLMARADHPNTPKPEADLARRQAESLMEKYRLTEEDMVQSGEMAATVGFREIILCRSGSEFRDYYYSLGLQVAGHLDLPYSVKYKTDDEGWRVIALEFVGYESDLAIADLMVTEMINAFGKHLEPKYDPTESNEENAWRLRSGGWERARIASVLYGPSETENEQKAKNRKVTALIRQYADRHDGLDADDLLGRGNNIKGYRKSFADAFLNTLVRRLWEMREARSEGGAIVFANRRDRLMEALYERYPDRRPMPRTADLEGSFPAKECPKCLRAKTGYCREHKPAAYPRSRATGPSYSSAGARRGREAAASVNIGSGPAKKISH